MDEAIRQAVEMFPQLTEEEKAIVHELIRYLKQNPEHAAVPQEQAEQNQ